MKNVVKEYRGINSNSSKGSISNDMEKANSEVETRMKHKGVGSGEAYETKYLDETKMLDECQLVIEEVKKNHVIG